MVKSKNNEIVTNADLINIKLYARYAVLAPDSLKKTQFFLGYDNSDISLLSPESFHELFLEVNNNGRYWRSTIEAQFKSCLRSMKDLYQLHYPSLEEALEQLDKLLDEGKIVQNPLADLDLSDEQQTVINDVHRILYNAWYDLSYAEAENQSAANSLSAFRKNIDHTRILIIKKIEFIQYVDTSSLRALLYKLQDDFNFMLDFSISAEQASLSLWAQWLSLCGELDNAHRSIGNISCQADIYDLYVDLLDIINVMQSVNVENSYMLTCFEQADNDYRVNYPCGFVPLGRYLDNCKDISVFLRGQCRNQNGSWQAFSINLTKHDPVKTEVLYDNGALIIDINFPITRGYCYFPGGDYEGHCQNIRVELTANCLSDSGSYIPSSLVLTHELYLEVNNINGCLVIN